MRMAIGHALFLSLTLVSVPGIAEKEIPTIVEYAAIGNMDKVDELVDAGVDVDLADRRGRTALIATAQAGCTDCILDLLRHGASLEKRDDAQHTALTTAIWYSQLNAVHVLLLAGADPEAQGNLSPLYWAAIQGVPDIVHLLIAAGSDVHRTALTGDTPLLRAACNGHEEAVRLLATAGSIIDAQSNEGTSALMCAIKKGQAETVIRTLLALGANPNLRDRKGDCAWSIAVGKADERVLDALRSAGARPCSPPAAQP